MITWIISQLRSLLGGGASYLLLSLGAVILFQHWQINSVKADHASIKAAHDQALIRITEQNSLITSQTRQYSRQTQHQKEQVYAQDVIQSVPDSDNCVGSAPVSNALDWLREREGNARQTDDD